MVLHLSRSKRALYPRAQIESDRATHSGFLNLGLSTRCICSANKRVAGVDQGPVARPCRGYGAVERDTFRCQQWPHSTGKLIDGLGRSLVACHLHVRWLGGTVLHLTTCLFREALRFPESDVVSPISVETTGKS